jgi:bifunctional DNA-binding transcriptional regulator/antitoxin component of YhaV-PrlF toxin-antitoxin module
MGMKTTVARASTKSDSLRTTVPAGIVNQFNLKEGDILDWSIEPRKNKLIIVVTVPKEETNE